MINIKQYDLEKILSINNDLKIQEHVVEDLFYITIDNFFKNPDDLVDFLIQFPSDNIQQKLNCNEFDFKNNNYRCPPGIQQIIHPRYLEGLSIRLIEILTETNFIPNTKNKTENSSSEVYYNQINNFGYYTNYIGPEAVSFRQNHIPHIDQCKFTFNFHLSKNVNSGLNFYKLKTKNKTHSRLKSILDDSIEVRKEISSKLNDASNLNFNENNIKKYKSIIEDDLFVCYEECDFKFNRLVLYEGDYWHSIKYDANVEKNPRYSLVSTYNFNKDETP